MALSAWRVPGSPGLYQLQLQLSCQGAPCIKPLGTSPAHAPPPLQLPLRGTPCTEYPGTLALHPLQLQLPYWDVLYTESRGTPQCAPTSPTAVLSGHSLRASGPSQSMPTLAPAIPLGQPQQRVLGLQAHARHRSTQPKPLSTHSLHRDGHNPSRLEAAVPPNS